MAQQPRKQTRNSGRTGEGMNETMDSDTEQTEQRGEQARSQKARGHQQGQQRQARGGQVQTQSQGPAQDVLAAITPALQEARAYVEGSPLRAAAVGAIAGGVLMSIFASEKGRQFVKMAYDYANPMVAKYAREYISQAAGDLAENAVSQH